MATHSTGNTAVDDVLTTYLNKTFVEDLMFDLQHQKFTKKGDIPPGGGNILRFVEFSPPRANAGYSGAGASAITEGSTTANEITGITTTGTNLTMAEFGEFVKVTSLYDIAAQPGTREEIRKRMRDGAAVSLDSYTHSKSRQTTNSIWATGSQTGGSTTIAATTTLGATTIILAKKVLKDGLATPFTGIPGHPDKHFAAVITEKQELDVVTEVTTLRLYWANAVVNVPGALGQEKFVNGYIGSIYGTAVYTTNNFATTIFTSTGVDIGYVYACDGVGAASLGDMDPKIILNDVNSPYKNLDSIAWHAFYEAALLRSVSVVKMYSNT